MCLTGKGHVVHNLKRVPVENKITHFDDAQSEATARGRRQEPTRNLYLFSDRLYCQLYSRACVKDHERLDIEVDISGYIFYVDLEDRGFDGGHRASGESHAGCSNHLQTVDKGWKAGDLKTRGYSARRH